MDVTWAKAKLEEYLGLCRLIREAVPPGELWNDSARTLNEQAVLMLTTVEKILHKVDPADATELLPPSYSSGGGEVRVRRALGALRDQADLDAHMAASGPEMPADELHPFVWAPAATIWDTGEFRAAVGQAALALETRIKARAKSRLTGKKLMQDVFSSEAPKPGTTRLQLPGDRDDETWRSRQQGLHQLAQGAYSGIRNVAAHDEQPLSEQVALEYLAVLSVVARWSEEAEPVVG
ncbi:TIGR02391 family protein [Cellulomonas xiejunii]|uniref:TIGR02391 family protein n=1 Tax=Cellulomonas xiejunii TaxID=2968083 RepID=UPI001D0DC582|nr:TIGR02391 family protein [Cellulomonas xiejunii]MCC2313475.1 TIGR02391 family protein [Cellulomonas xiejunii]